MISITSLITIAGVTILVVSCSFSEAFSPRSHWSIVTSVGEVESSSSSIIAAKQQPPHYTSSSAVLLQLRSDSSSSSPSNIDDDNDDSTITQRRRKLISDFCQGTNEFWKRLVIRPVRDYVEVQPAGTTAPSNVLSKLTAPPELPGLPRPVWFTILGSVPTALVWYGYYKFSVEEELYQYELQNNSKHYVTGCGGYGTLFPFVYGILVGFPLQHWLHIPAGETIVQAAALWILLGQVNLYRRVNELCEEAAQEGLMDLKEPPLHSWWALLPPPLDVVVGLRQVHFLSEYWRLQRNEPYDKDIIAEDLFPFISAPRFTLKEFFRTPSMWFWFTKDLKDFDFKFLKD